MSRYRFRTIDRHSRRFASILAGLIVATGVARAADAPVVPAADPARAEAPAGAPAAAELPSGLTSQILYEFLLGEVALQRGQAQIAAQAFADLARRTRDPRIARRAAELAAYARSPELAVEAAKIWNDAEPASEEARRALAGLLVSANRLEEAQPYLERIVAGTVPGSPEGAQMFELLNRLLAASADKPGALRVMRKLVEPYPEIPEAHMALARSAAAANEDGAAIAEAQAAQKLRPEWELPVLFEAGVLQKQSNPAALARLRAYLDTNPKSREVRLAYARTLAADRQIGPARIEFQQLTADNPDNVDIVYAIALLSMQLEDYALAESSLKRLLELPFRDQSLVRLYLGQIAEDQKRYPEALNWYREVAAGEQYLPAQIRIAQVIARQGDVNGARESLQRVSPQNVRQEVQIIIAESQILRDANRMQDAYATLEKAIARLPGEADLHYDFAMLAEKLDRVDVMEANLRKVIEMRPDHAHAYNALGYSLADRSLRLTEARELVERAHKLAPDDYFIMDSVGWVLYRQGDLEGAMKYLQRAFNGRQDAEIAAHLGEVLWALGRRDEAERLWRGAASKTPDNDTLVKTMKRFLQTSADAK